MPSLRAAISLFLFCAETSVIRAHPRKQKTNKKNEQGLSSPRSIHVPNPCNTFCLQCQMLVASHTHWGEKKRRVHKENGWSRTGLNGGGKGLCACALKLQHGSSSPLTSLLNWLLPAGLAVPVCCCPQRFIVSYSGVCSPTTGGPREENGCLNISTFM